MAKVLFCTLALCAVAAAQRNNFNNLVGRSPSSSVAQSGLAQIQDDLQTKDSLSQIDLARLEAKLRAIIDVSRRALKTAGDIAEASIRSVILEEVDNGWRDPRIGRIWRNGRDGSDSINGNRGSSSIGTQTNIPAVISRGRGSGSGRSGNQQSSGNNNGDNVAVAVADSQQNSGNDQ